MLWTGCRCITFDLKVEYNQPFVVNILKIKILPDNIIQMIVFAEIIYEGETDIC